MHILRAPSSRDWNGLELPLHLLLRARPAHMQQSGRCATMWRRGEHVAIVRAQRGAEGAANVTSDERLSGFAERLEAAEDEHPTATDVGRGLERPRACRARR